jgi:transketolase
MPSRQDLSNAIRFLSIDAVQKANSGHPGAPMGMANIAEVLWNDFLQHNPTNPQWVNRDRFVLSNGHASMLLYSVLHLTGYDLSIEDIKQFRQLHSKTPGHPEHGITPGVETTTGPLGQGLANAVGMAIAERALATEFNRDEHKIVDHDTYVFLGDGCLMEGISHEVCSLAGTLGLGKLIAFWDDNHISIDGHTDGWFTENIPERFAAYGWHVIADIDGHNPDAIHQAILKAKAVTDKPSLVCCKTIIGWGAPSSAGSHDTHGSPLGAAEIAATRENLNWHYAPFDIPEAIYTAWDAKAKGAEREKNWQQQFVAYQAAYPTLAAEFLRRVSGELPADFSIQAQQFVAATQTKSENIASRKASQNSIEHYAPLLPELLGGSADLTGSNLTNWSGTKALDKNTPGGNYIHYGVREFGMSAIMTGIALHGGFIPYGGTFLTFVDYARNAVRMAALMKQRVIFVYTHDSIGLGEDGPTHQPIEHLTMLRATPNLAVWRPCDATETAVAWQLALERQHAPTCLIFSRQTLPHQVRSTDVVNNIHRGGYILLDCAGTPEAILIATGSEVILAIDAAKTLQQENRRIRVVSMPSNDAFDQQTKEYQQSVLPDAVTTRVAIEAGSPLSWYKYVSPQKGRIISLDHYGDSAPAADLFKTFGFTIEHVIKTIKEII